jgi:hypothetical protein
MSLIFLSFGVTLLFFYNLGVLLYTPCMLEFHLFAILINIDYFKNKNKKCLLVLVIMISRVLT